MFRYHQSEGVEFLEGCGYGCRERRFGDRLLFKDKRIAHGKCYSSGPNSPTLPNETCRDDLLLVIIMGAVIVRQKLADLQTGHSAKRDSDNCCTMSYVFLHFAHL